MDQVIKQFVACLDPAQAYQIVSLGGGSDTTFFRMPALGVRMPTQYVEVDLPEVVKEKIGMFVC